MQPSSAKSAQGITLVELIIVVAIASVLGMFTVNSIASIVHKSRAGLASIGIVDSLTRARSLAITSESDVVLCASSDNSNCSGGDHWESGWIGFADKHEDGERHDG